MKELQSLFDILKESGYVPDGVELTEGTTFDQLGFDSLDKIELLMSVEEEYDVSVADEVAEQWQTVGDVARYLDQVK